MQEPLDCHSAYVVVSDLERKEEEKARKEARVRPHGKEQERLSQSSPNRTDTCARKPALHTYIHTST